VIFDTAPTGHTIRLLELPVDWSKHIEESSKGSGQTCMGPVALLEDSKKKYDDAVDKLKNSSLTDFIFVMQPEETSLEETKRSSNELKEIGIKTTGIIVNGFILKEEAINHFFKSRYDMQQRYLEKAKEAFEGIKIKTMELFDSELKGIDMFRLSSVKLYKDVVVKSNKEDLVDVSNLIYPVKGKQKNIFFSGKGGVGKTSMACITAIRTAMKGYKTLLMTTDPAAHIGNVLEKNISSEITKVDDIENLHAVRIDQKKATKEYIEKIVNDAKSKFDENTIKAIEEELNSPCTEEMAAFQKFVEYASSEEYEVIVFDTAPTGHTLRLLELPMDWSKQIQFKAGESAEISEEDKIQKERFDKVIDMMKDKEITTFGFVMYPEKTPIIEAYRASKELETLEIKTQLVVANLIIPEEQAITRFMVNRRNMQLKYIKEIENRFNNASIIKIPMYDKEVKGIEMLKDISKQIF